MSRPLSFPIRNEAARGRRRGQVYGRRLSRPLRAQQQALVDDVLPRVGFRLTDGAAIDTGNLFGRVGPVWLEIGFGGGEHLADRAGANRSVGIIGVEPFINGVVKLLASIEDGQLDNVRLIQDDARLVLAALPDRSISRAFIHYPDPWPKKRHNRRRIVSDAVLDHLARVLTSGAELRMTTDDADYAAWMLVHMARHRSFVWLAERPSDWQQRPLDQIETRYESKARMAGRAPCYLRFRRL